jgi:hypothetical protein
MSQPIGSLFGGCNPVVSTTNPGKVIHKYGIFELEEDLNNSPWFVPTPLKFAHLVHPLPHKFKQHLPLFHGDGTVTVVEHLRAFSNACTILGVNDNDSCMILFMNSLQGNVASLFSNLPDECISTWFELSYWFTSTFGHLDNPYEHLKRFNQLHMKDNESILTFNLRFIKSYNSIPTPIRPTNLVSLLHYYELLPPLYRWRLEEKNVQNLELALTTCLDFEEKICRTGFSFGIHDSHKYLSSFIPIIKSLQDHMFFLESQSQIMLGVYLGSPLS